VESEVAIVLLIFAVLVLILIVILITVSIVLTVLVVLVAVLILVVFILILIAHKNTSLSVNSIYKIMGIIQMEKFFQEIKNLIPKDYDEFLSCYSKPPYKGLRVNTLKCDYEKLSSLLPFELTPTPFFSEEYYYPNSITGLGKNPLHHSGAFYIQEPSASSAVAMMGVEQGDIVLDMCSAPGGKSTQIASLLKGNGLLVSNEIVKNRSNVLLSNIERMGIKNAVVISCHPQTIAEKLTGFFDKVLVDAPCSGEGMFRKDNEAKAEWSYEHTLTCAVRQLEILNSAKACLKENGVLVYSTCTYNTRENEGVIEKFIEENPDFVIEDSGQSFGRNTLKYAKRIFLNDGGEGHFCCRLRKTSPAEGYTEGYSYTTPKNKKEILEFYDSLFKGRPFGENIEVIGTRVYAVPDNMPNLKGINVLRSGILLGEIKKNRIEPAHSAFMAVTPQQCVNSVDFRLDDENIRRFLHGEEISVDKNIKGYTAVAVEGIVTGFGKASNGTLKNKYPKGLRNL
jgi:NOL1/NOP2/sun family putative RNA methylase